MSRIGKAPIAITKGVTVTIQDGNIVTVKGPKGELTRSVPAAMQLSQEDGQVLVKRPDDEPGNKSLHGLTRTLIANMVEGVTKGFAKQLELVGVGRAATPRAVRELLALQSSDWAFIMKTGTMVEYAVSTAAPSASWTSPRVETMSLPAATRMFSIVTTTCRTSPARTGR